MSLYLDSIQQRFRTYYDMGTKTIERLDNTQLHWQPQGEPNSIALLVKHLRGNMLSRWTDFLTTDGEKPGRHRDQEFEDDQASTEAVLQRWKEGWDCLLKAVDGLKEEDLGKTIYIRTEPHTVLDAVNRQLGHVAYHVGQMVFLGKMILGENWQSLSIPKGQSEAFNKQKSGNK
ncbi:DUF1572 family protein [Chitinophaga flava]|uniref:DUF1572 domain-containing protein n=1 Tax=Chitinophaga flava TaxID=2259036 RepID=A0A365Y0W8_9BACT|nr:DUF1572 family protein [Chitinophaga flava]RBL91891.1 hypothetical protein DF182_04635 [Chitinophaga flava]